MKQKLDESHAYLTNNGIETADYGIVLGTGLGDLINEIQTCEMNYLVWKYQMVKLSDQTAYHLQFFEERYR